jgi:3-oxoacyl-[acyl-carrier-protein] synthase III
LHNNYINDNDFKAIYFGTNEYLNFTRKEVIDMVQNAKEITNSEIEVFDRYMPHPAAIDIVDRILEAMYCNANNSKNYALEERLKKLNQRN